jgi:hypothetical protein
MSLPRATSSVTNLQKSGRPAGALCKYLGLRALGADPKCIRLYIRAVGCRPARSSLLCCLCRVGLEQRPEEIGRQPSSARKPRLAVYALRLQSPPGIRVEPGPSLSRLRRWSIEPFGTISTATATATATTGRANDGGSVGFRAARGDVLEASLDDARFPRSGRLRHAVRAEDRDGPRLADGLLNGT